MKKLMALMMAIVCVLTMTACGGEKQKSVSAFTVETVNEVQKAGAFSEELEELDADTAFMLYKLADYGLVREDLSTSDRISR